MLHCLNRRKMIAASTGLFASAAAPALTPRAAAAVASTDSMPMQLYKSLSDQQREKVCLPSDHKSRQFVSNWWYIHREHRIPGTFDADQQALIQKIFDSMHSAEHQDAVNDQVQFDQYGQIKNAPAVGFFGSPADDDFEFIYTGHHVTRRCNAHTDEGLGFGGAPIFYGHFREAFHETKDHPGNPYWYQGKVFNKFVQSLTGAQQKKGLVSGKPRSERADAVIKKNANPTLGLDCADLDAEQRKVFVDTIRGMMAMFRQDDVDATVKTIEDKKMLDDLHVSWFGGKYDVGGDKVWDTWQIEGPEMVWYFRGEPHIHSYFHLKT